MNLWQIITGNSTLPVQAGTNLWDHLNNQEGGGSGDTYIVQATESFEVRMAAMGYEVTFPRLDVESHLVAIDASVTLNSIDIEKELQNG